jgi:hypothetical protein
MNGLYIHEDNMYWFNINCNKIEINNKKLRLDLGG